MHHKTWTQRRFSRPYSTSPSYLFLLGSGNGDFSLDLVWSMSSLTKLMLILAISHMFSITWGVLFWNTFHSMCSVRMKSSSVRVANLDPRSYRIYHLRNLIDTYNYKCLIREWMNVWVGLNSCIGLQESPRWFNYLWGTYHYLFHLNSGSPKDRLRDSRSICLWVSYLNWAFIKAILVRSTSLYYHLRPSSSLLSWPTRVTLYTQFCLQSYLLPSHTLSSASLVFKKIDWFLLFPCLDTYKVTCCSSVKNQDSSVNDLQRSVWSDVYRPLQSLLKRLMVSLVTFFSCTSI